MKLFTTLAVFIASFISTILAGDCNNPLLNIFNISSLGTPTTVTGLKYCKSLQSGQSCCSADTVNGFQERADALAEKLQAIVASRDKQIMDTRNNVLPQLKASLQQLRDNSQQALGVLKGKMSGNNTNATNGQNPPQGGNQTGQMPPPQGGNQTGQLPPPPPNGTNNTDNSTLPPPQGQFPPPPNGTNNTDNSTLPPPPQGQGMMPPPPNGTNNTDNSTLPPPEGQFPPPPNGTNNTDNSTMPPPPQGQGMMPPPPNGTNDTDNSTNPPPQGQFPPPPNGTNNTDNSTMPPPPQGQFPPPPNGTNNTGNGTQPPPQGQFPPPPNGTNNTGNGTRPPPQGQGQGQGGQGQGQGQQPPANNSQQGQSNPISASDPDLSQAASLIQTIGQLSQQVVNGLPQIVGNFSNFQKSRSTCVVEMVKLQAAAWCLSCDPEYASKGVSGTDNVSLSNGVCSRLQSSCYDFISQSAQQSSLLSVQSLAPKIGLVAAGIQMIISDNSTGLTQLLSAINSTNSTNSTTAPVGVPPNCTAESCPWICTDLFKNGQVNNTLVSTGGEISSLGDDTTTDDSSVSSRLLVEEGTVVKSKLGRRRVLSSSEWSPDSDEAGVAVSFPDDPASVNTAVSVSTSDSASGAGLVKASLMAVVALVMILMI